MSPSSQLTPSAAQVLRDGTAVGSWVLDASRSQVQLKTKSMWGLAPVKGEFRQVSGTGTVSPAGEATGTVTVAAASVDTKNKKRDDHLRSADFFDVANHPDITFTVDQVRPSGTGVTVSGQLSVRGRTRPASFDAQVSRIDGDEVHLDGDLLVDRAGFGLTWSPMGMASLNNTITVHAVFTRQAQ
jgi:polyisoprenoid-binding protein YceI